MSVGQKSYIILKSMTYTRTTAIKLIFYTEYLNGLPSEMKKISKHHRTKLFK